MLELPLQGPAFGDVGVQECPCPTLGGLEQSQQGQSPAGVAGVPVTHGCNVTWPQSSPCPSQVSPVMQVSPTWAVFSQRISSCRSCTDPSLQQSPAGVQLLLSHGFAVPGAPGIIPSAAPQVFLAHWCSGHLHWHQTGQTGMDSGSPGVDSPASPALDWDSWKNSPVLWTFLRLWDKTSHFWGFPLFFLAPAR